MGVWPKFFDRIVFERSDDSGKTFTSTDVGFHEGKMQDKPWFSMDEWQGSKGFGNVYLSWTEFDAVRYFSGKPEKWFGLDGSMVSTELVPVIIAPRAQTTLKRIK